MLRDSCPLSEGKAVCPWSSHSASLGDSFFICEGESDPMNIEACLVLTL